MQSNETHSKVVAGELTKNFEGLSVGEPTNGTNSDVSPSLARATVKISDALEFVDTVKAKFAEDEPEVYDEFLALMIDFKNERIDTDDVVGRIKQLFSDHPDLITSFENFLPSSYSAAGQVEVSSKGSREVEGDSEDSEDSGTASPGNGSRSVTPTPDDIHKEKPRQKGIEEPTVAYIQRVKNQCDVEIWEQFMAILARQYDDPEFFDEDEMVKDVEELFEDHTELIPEFRTFLAGEKRDRKPASRPKIVITRDLGPEASALISPKDAFEIVQWPEDRSCGKSWILENVPGAAALIVTVVDKVDTEVLDAAGDNLLIVSTMSVGYEHLDVQAIASRGIKIGFTPEVLTDAVADIAVMLALMTGRNVRETMQIVNEGRWPNFSWAPFLFCGPQLGSSPVSPRRTAGFIGFGRISQATLTRLIPFGITDCLYTGNPQSKPDPDHDEALRQKFDLQTLRRVDLDELARKSDAIFVLAPGGPSTYHVVNEAFLQKMKKTSILVNAARGSLVDSDALAKALREKWIWGAGIDVVEGEPNVTQDHPLVKEPRCAVIPHIGSATTETRVGMATLAVENAMAVLTNKPMPKELLL
ncbi:Glyoxylate reductase/hydroxypyruvate reductase [Leucoagaricus sp. SymC.cos]|nr:Glyoxylate reductase/hydroxypyruvate reductase [Leucoagaricus sp. SymC.cos]